jgi:hypothetical protein
MIRAVFIAVILAAAPVAAFAGDKGGDHAEAVSVPGPLLGLGLPGILAAVGYVAWRRSRNA